MDLNSATGSLLGVVRAFVIFYTKEEGYPLETSTDDRCLELSFKLKLQKLTTLHH